MRKTMRMLAGRAAAAAALLAWAAPAAGQQQVSAGHALAPDGLVRVWAGAGTLRVEGWDRDSVTVTGTIPPGKRFMLGGSRAGVKSAIDHMEEGDVSHLVVRVPRGSQVWLKTAAGDVTVTGLSGTLDVYTVTGAVTVSGNLRATRLESMGGPLTVTGSAASLVARTATGDLRLAAAVEDATATTVSGRLLLDAARVQRGRFETVDGPIRWDGALLRGSALEFVTHGGGVELFLPRATAGEFELNSFQGTVRSELGGPRAAGGGRKEAFVLGDGGGTHVSVRSFRGDVAIRRK